ncbi:MAG: DUF6516 family protein [Burkholderiaceae bacterium]|jgi:hypothetical protein|nr:DUF6516 family protein [Burkholderiaceae bacterium]
MAAIRLIRRKIVYAENAFAELVVWELPVPLPGSRHGFKFRLAYVVGGECVLRYDNELGSKGGHRHLGAAEYPYEFSDLETLVDDFQRDIERWNRENRNPGCS